MILVADTPFDISIHALHEESDMCRRNDSPYRSTFQSTLSMRRATRRYRVHRNSGRISIHALHEESDAVARFRVAPTGHFNPRSP